MTFFMNPRALACSRRTAAALALGACLASVADAATLQLRQGLNGYTGTADNSIFQDNPNNSSGGFPYLYVGKTQSASPRRILLKFNLAALPANAQVSSATLQLNVSDISRPGNMAVSLHKVTAPWVEGNAPIPSASQGGTGTAAEPGDSTWNHASQPGTAWVTPGGDHAAGVSASGTIGGTLTTTLISGGTLAADIQAWAAAPGTNNGWLLIGDEAGIGNAKRLYSSEAPSTLQPTLFIEYTSAGPTAAENWQLYP